MVRYISPGVQVGALEPAGYSRRVRVVDSPWEVMKSLDEGAVTSSCGDVAFQGAGHRSEEVGSAARGASRVRSVLQTRLGQGALGWRTRVSTERLLGICPQ